jgi:hypothetical protein
MGVFFSTQPLKTTCGDRLVTVCAELALILSVRGLYSPYFLRSHFDNARQLICGWLLQLSRPLSEFL